MQKIRDYAQFIKLRLSSLVVFSAAICYAIGAEQFEWSQLWYLVLGGFLVTGSSNGFNQIIERDTDKLMDRTANRPLPTQRMSITEGLILASLLGIIGILILYFKMNALSGILGALALILYTLVYTPLKRITPFAVFVGAFPGAIPPMLGWVAATGELSFQAWILFFIQFMWQFPHFWAIAWVLDDDYKKAGFQMLPSGGGRDKRSAFQILIYTVTLLPISLFPVLFNMSGTISALVISICGILFLMQAIKLYKTRSLKAAQQLMFGSFLYLPVVQLSLLFDKI